MNHTFKIYLTLSTFIFLLSCNKQAKDDAKGLFIRGNIALQDKNYKVAIQKYDDCIEKTPEFADCYNNRGLAKKQLENLKSAMNDFQKAIEIDDKFYQARFNLASVQSDLGEYQASEETLKKLEKVYKDSSFYHMLIGVNHTKLNHFSDAIIAFQQAISLNKNNYEALTNLGFVQFQEKDFKAAKQQFLRAISINPTADFALNNLALIEIKEENYPKAMEYIDRAIAKNSVQPYYINNKGYVLLQQKKNAEAKTLIEQSLKIDDKNAWAYRNLGIYYLNTSSQQANDNNKALENFIQAEKLEPSVENINYYIATTLIKLNKKEEAQKYFDIEKKLNQ